MRSEVRNQSQRGSWAAKRLTLDLRFKPHVGLHAGHGAYLNKTKQTGLSSSSQVGTCIFFEFTSIVLLGQPVCPSGIPVCPASRPLVNTEPVLPFFWS